jgi:RNA-directed DNA polymerase
MSFAQIAASGLEAWLAGLREELVSKTYRPDPARRPSH